jgi:hypothetical protein
MLSRRELIAAGVAGSLSSSPGDDVELPPATEPSAEHQADREGQREIARQVQSVVGTLSSAFLTSSLSHGFVVKLRQEMETFVRSNNKFPDFFDVGIGVFYELYDWHVKNRQQVTVVRMGDGRYAIQFMFSSLILRPEQDRNYIGIPYDRV